MGVFVPTADNYFLSYPEFKNIREFNNLDEPDLRLSYYLGCPGSPLDKEKDKKAKLLKALDLVFGNSPDKVGLEKIKAYSTRGLPDTISKAVERFSKFNVSVRTSANENAMLIFRNSLLACSMSETQYLALEIDARKKYIEIGLKVVELHKIIIPIIEEGFGTRSANDAIMGTEELSLASQAMNTYNK